MDKFSLPKLAVPAVLCLISFLSFSSQYLFYQIQPGHLKGQEFLIFNGLVTCLLICYARAILTDPGRISSTWQDGVKDTPAKDVNDINRRQKWCRKCSAPKPPRAHHCKICKRCIPKMDHHCPWTINCVSHRTFPHFIRFLLFACAAMTYLEFFLYERGAALWRDRRMPSIYGPSIFQLLHLFALIFTNSMTLFALAILFVRSAWSLAVNTFTIEGWEVERHETLVRRARYLGGYLDGPGGIRVKIVKQEFPYDIGIWQNLCQGMGTVNVLAWFWPFAWSLPLDSGLTWPTNGFENPSIGWPPPDPDRIPRPSRAFDPSQAFVDPNDMGSDESRVAAFQKRQQQDRLRQAQQFATGQVGSRESGHAVRRRKFADRFDADGCVRNEDDEQSDVQSEDGEQAWRNAEGERLDDFGVDEDAEFYDEEAIPLAELMRRRRQET